VCTQTVEVASMAKLDKKMSDTKKIRATKKVR